MRKKSIHCVTLDIADVEELRDYEKRLGVALPLSTEVQRGFRLRLDQLKAKFTFKSKETT